MAVAREPFITISGIIGCGKTTLTEQLAKVMGLPSCYEPVLDNDVLVDFYKDMKANSFRLQISLLMKRFKLHQNIVWSGRGGVSDRSIYEDIVFARVLTGTGGMTPGEYTEYRNAFDIMENFMRHPDVILHLDVSPESAMSRIMARGREMEKSITIGYLTSLKDEYEKFIVEVSAKIPVLRVNWEEFHDARELVPHINKLLKNRQNITYATF